MKDLVNRADVIDTLIRCAGVGNRALTVIREIPSAEVNRWIPSDVMLPETDEKVLCQTVTKKGVTSFVIGYCMDGEWRCGMNSNVVAWQPLPAPWEDK